MMRKCETCEHVEEKGYVERGEWVEAPTGLRRHIRLVAREMRPAPKEVFMVFGPETACGLLWKGIK